MKRSQFGTYLTSLIDFRAIVVALALLHLVITQVGVTRWYQNFGSGPVATYPDASLVVPVMLMLAAVMLHLQKTWSYLVALLFSGWIIYSVGYLGLRSVALAHDLRLVSTHSLKLWLAQTYAGQPQKFLQLALAMAIIIFVITFFIRVSRSKT
jgi:hypothetical protein